MFNFGKNQNVPAMNGNVTKEKKMYLRIRNLCGLLGMIALELAFVVVRLLDAPGYTVMILEILLLSMFGFAWLVTEEVIPENHESL